VLVCVVLETLCSYHVCTLPAGSSSCLCGGGVSYIYYVYVYIMIKFMYTEQHQLRIHVTLFYILFVCE
jgi:hypothetical protein